jgi:hypothetical protein
MESFKVDGWSNFCRVFELPEKFSSEYCFGGGIDTNFKMVDWFNPLDLPQPTVTKDIWKKVIGDIEVIEITSTELKEKLIDFLQQKKYVKPNRKYLLIANFGATFIFAKD